MNIEIIKSMLNQKGYYMFNKTYKNAKTKLILFDNNGYLYYTTFDNLSSNKTPCIVSRYNPFSIRNIHNYIHINHINTTLVSETFYNASALLEFKCKCGNRYYTSWDKFSGRGKVVCNSCARKESGLKSRNDNKLIYDEFISKGYIPEINRNLTSTAKITCTDKDGYKGLLSYHKLTSGNNIEKFSCKNPYLIDNINNFIKRNNYTCTFVQSSLDLSKNFATQDIQIKCECGNVYHTKWKVFLKMGNYRCPICSKKQSKYANILEIFLKNNNILYKKEVSFDDCYDVGKLYFDFAIYNIDRLICLIEVDGQFYFKDYYGQLAGQLKRDQIKNEYCQRKKIKLLRIPYWDVTNNKYIDYLERNLLSYYKYG